jgi:hypothetical protein
MICGYIGCFNEDVRQSRNQLILCFCCSSTKGTSFWAFLFGLSGFLKAFLCKSNGVPSFETAQKGLLQEYGGFLQESTT